MRVALLCALALAACKPPTVAAERAPEVRYRPAQESPGALAEEALRRVPGAAWDLGLARATSLLTAAARTPSARITPEAAAAALGVAGYPGQAIFAREYNTGGSPEGLLRSMATEALRGAAPVDIALSKRSFEDGTALWIGALAPRPASLDPIPRDPELDGLVPVRVDAELEPGATLTLFVAGPDRPVQAVELTPGLARWVDGFSLPGEYRLEVVASWPETRGTTPSQVLLLWSHFVDTPPEPPGNLPRASASAPDPMEATEALYVALAERRAQAGLPPVQRFPRFEPLAREHAALMASQGQAAHILPGVTPGVPTVAAQGFHPRAVHLEDVAAAASWEDALDLVWLSPGHRRTLLCEDCSHAAIGASLEPVIDHVPRLFVVWEMLSFPNGEPLPVERTQR
ncbi:MAG: hypothetical protein H6740_04290 [Alphaproteobacteria bacterium]|nr:hypothetical protein [Alphaproteobacteria bacterium]